MKKQILICSLMLSIFLTGCSSVKQMEKSFAQIHTLETEMSNIQEKVYLLDEEETIIYEEIIAMGGTNEKEIEQLANEAYSKLEEKSRRLQEEQEIFIEAKEELTKVVKINDEKIDEPFDEMILLLQERYTYYDEMHKEQVQSIQANEQLYELLVQGANRKQIEEILQKINEHEAVIRAKHEQLNVLTEKYNEVVQER